MVIEEQVIDKDFLGQTDAAPHLSLMYGAQNGYVPRLGGKDHGKTFAEWVSATPHVANQIIAIPLYAPGFFNVVAGPQQARELQKIWADVFSVHCKTITGLNSTLTTETAETQMGPSGSMFLEEDTKVTRERSQLSYGFDERLGRSIGNFLDFLIRNTAGHEHTQTPLIASNPKFRKYMKGRAWTSDMKSGVILYAEMDVINVNVIKAWLAGNVRNKKGGTIEGKYDISAGRELVTYDVDMMAFVESGEYIRRYAQHIVDRMNVFLTNPETDLPIFMNKDDANNMMNNPDGTGFNGDAGMSGKIDIG